MEEWEQIPHSGTPAPFLCWGGQMWKKGLLHLGHDFPKSVWTYGSQPL